MTIDKDGVISELRVQLAEQAKRLDALEREIASLRERLAKYEVPKNSTNSSVPPSQDPFRKARSLRPKGTKRPGGQKGHKGGRLEMRAAPDHIVLHDVGECSNCGGALAGDADGFDARQVFDMPPVKMEAAEHRRAHRTCARCGHANRGAFPEGLVRGARYGNRTKSLCAYLQNYHMLPFYRCAELVGDLTGHPISTGSLSNFQKQCHGHLEGYEREVKKLLLRAPVLHADETGARTNGKNHWFHVLSNKDIGLFAHHAKRGREAMDDMGLLENYGGTLVHDRFASYFSYKCGHALCNAHILRDLAYIEEASGAPWAKEM